MAETMHTPGPWAVEAGGKRGAWIGRDGEWAALACGGTDEIANANARLIAAAPTMYDYIFGRASVGDAAAAAILENIHANP